MKWIGLGERLDHRSGYANRLTRLPKVVIQPCDPNIIGIAATHSHSGLYRANIQRFVGPGFLHRRRFNYFLLGHGGRAMILSATDHIGMLGAAQHSSTETQNAA